MNSSSWASTWFVNEALMTNDGCPVALPRFMQASLAEHEHAAAVRQAPLVHLRLDLDLLDAGDRREAGHVDLVVEVADVADDREVLEAQQVLGGDDARVAGARDDDVDLVDDRLEAGDLEAVHRRLQRADRVDLADDDARALAAERLGRALADVAVARDEGDLAAHQHVGGAVEAVGQRVADAVVVVELRLGDRVVDVDRREEQVARMPRARTGGARRWWSPRSRR